MPPAIVRTAFKIQGAQDEMDYVSKGHEFRRTMKFYNHKGPFIASVIFAMIAGAAPLVMNVVMGDMLNVMTQNISFLDTVKTLILRMVYVVLAMTVSTVIFMFFRAIASPRMMSDLRIALYSSLVEQEIAYFDEVATGVLIGRLSEDVNLIRETYVEKLTTIIQMLSQAAAGICLGFATVWRVELAVFPAVPLSAIVFVVGERFVDKLWLKFNDATMECSGKAQEVITQFRTVKSFDNELHEARLYTKGVRGIQNVYKRVSVVHGVKDGIVVLLMWSMIACLMYYTTWLMVRKPEYKVEPGDLMILMMASMMGMMGVSQAMSSIDDVKKASLSAGKVLDIIERVPEVERHAGANDINGEPNVKGKIEFRDVGFSYKTREGYAVRHLNFIINPGETVALVGESGCGKSTTLQLLQRFYEISEGTILVDDVDIKELSQVYLRSQISIVPQGPVLFSMSIKDNIRYMKHGASDSDVAEAAQTGNAHKFIMEMPDNYDTIVQQTSLSGGQKQRLCISRAILAHTPVLLLDEATAALDTESEQLVQQSIEATRQGRTAIVVAHRLATVLHADRILVFKDGEIAEEGTHTELLGKNGIYADLVKFQLE